MVCFQLLWLIEPGRVDRRAVLRVDIDRQKLLVRPSLPRPVIYPREENYIYAVWMQSQNYFFLIHWDGGVR